MRGKRIFAFLLKTIREQTDIKELTPQLVNTFIRRIEIHEAVKIGKEKTIAVDIFFTGIGLFTIPDSEELADLISYFSNHSA